MSLKRLAELTASLASKEETERMANKRLSTALSAAGAGVWDWETASNILRWDSQMVSLFGYHPLKFKRDDFGWFICTYADFIERVHPEDRIRVQELVDACLQDGKPYRTSYRVVHDDGSLHRVIQAAGDTHRDAENRIERLVGVCFESGEVDD